MKAAIRLMTLPADVLHELTHALAAAPWARRAGVELDFETGTATAGIDWRGGAEAVPTYAVLITMFAPLVLGIVLGLLGAWHIYRHGLGTGSELLVQAMLGVWWVYYTTPSGDDQHYSPGDNDG